MIQTKLIEIRDRGTFIPAMVIRVQSDGTKDSYLIRRAGWGNNPGLYLMHMKTCECKYDPYEWDTRTMRTVHNHLRECDFDELEHGIVLDVEYILGETHEPKKSEEEWTPQ